MPFAGLGRVQGRVTKADGNPLAYANVILVGTTMGAMTTAEGRFLIANVPAGTYTVRAMMMGFKAVEKDSVVVTAGGTAEVDFSLVVTVVMKSQEVVVTADRALIEVTESRTHGAVSEQQLQAMPADKALEAVGLKAGVVRSGDDMHVRGACRQSPVQVQIDGVPVPDPLGAARYAPPVDREQYEHIAENDFLSVIDNPLSTFSIDVDRASYANTRRFIRAGQRPPASSVRIEEFINYFDYDYPQPAAREPFSITTEIAGCPWTPAHRLVRIGLHGGRALTFGDLRRVVEIILDI